MVWLWRWSDEWIFLFIFSERSLLWPSCWKLMWFPPFCLYDGHFWSHLQAEKAPAENNKDKEQTEETLFLASVFVSFPSCIQSACRKLKNKAFSSEDLLFSERSWTTTFPRSNEPRRLGTLKSYSSQHGRAPNFEEFRWKISCFETLEFFSAFVKLWFIAALFSMSIYNRFGCAWS